MVSVSYFVAGLEMIFYAYPGLGGKEYASKQKLISCNAFDALAQVGGSTIEPPRCYHNITSNTLRVLGKQWQLMVKIVIYSNTCATYGEPENMLIIENAPQGAGLG